MIGQCHRRHYIHVDDEFGSCIDDDGGCVARLKEEEDGQAVRSADSKNWWPGFQGGPTAYVWHELPSAIAPIPASSKVFMHMSPCRADDG